MPLEISQTRQTEVLAKSIEMEKKPQPLPGRNPDKQDSPRKTFSNEPHSESAGDVIPTNWGNQADPYTSELKVDKRLYLCTLDLEDNKNGN